LKKHTSIVNIALLQRMANQARNNPSPYDLTEVAQNVFSLGGEVKPGKDWYIPNATDLPTLPKGVGYGCFTYPDSAVGAPLIRLIYKYNSKFKSHIGTDLK
jgi:hypothetical protein